jgi:hypothetical protein
LRRAANENSNDGHRRLLPLHHQRSRHSAAKASEKITPPKCYEYLQPEENHLNSKENITQRNLRVRLNSHAKSLQNRRRKNLQRA